MNKLQPGFNSNDKRCKEERGQRGVMLGTWVLLLENNIFVNPFFDSYIDRL